MQTAIISGPADQQTGGRPLARGEMSRQFWLTPPRAYVVSSAIVTIFFIADVTLPRGATAAIGYCLVPAVAAGTRRRGFLFGMTIICTLLTWAGYFLEPPGAAWWASMFDRVMVSGVLWLAFLLVWRRAVIIRALVHQTQALKDATRELERSNAELESFASVVAHDLRGPLNTVGLLVHLLSSCGSVQADAECRESIGSIQAELTRMSDFIQSLLNYGHIGSRNASLADCDCTAVLTAVRQNLKADLERHAGQITNDPLPVVRADPMLIGELFQNLIENSIKYRGEASPRIHVSAAQQRDGWLFSVRDNGIGIRAEDAERIFEPFRQGAGGTFPGRGVGLGLATCKRIVERHGGRIEVRSKAGAGATFFFTIPPRSAATGPASPPVTRELTQEEVQVIVRAG